MQKRDNVRGRGGGHWSPKRERKKRQRKNERGRTQSKKGLRRGAPRPIHIHGTHVGSWSRPPVGPWRVPNPLGSAGGTTGTPVVWDGSSRRPAHHHHGPLRLAFRYSPSLGHWTIYCVSPWYVSLYVYMYGVGAPFSILFGLSPSPLILPLSLFSLWASMSTSSSSHIVSFLLSFIVFFIPDDDVLWTRNASNYLCIKYTHIYRVNRFCCLCAS